MIPITRLATVSLEQPSDHRLAIAILIASAVLLILGSIGRKRKAAQHVPRPAPATYGCWIHDEFTKDCWMCGDGPTPRP